MTNAPDAAFRRSAPHRLDTAWTKALRRGCFVGFAGFWFILIVWPAAFGTGGGAWWTRVLEAADQNPALMAMIGAPSFVTLLIACNLRRPALLACTLAAAVGMDVFGAPLIISPALRVRQLHEGEVGVAILVGMICCYFAVALLTLVLVLARAARAVAKMRRRA